MAKGGSNGLDILSYKGDANLGIAGDAGALDAYGVIDAQPIAETARELAKQSVAINMARWRQNIAERDAVYKDLDDEKLVLDNIPEEHRGRLETEKQKIYDIWKKYNGDIYSDPKRYREFKGQIAQTKEAINQSQKWYLWASKEMADRAKDGNPVEQKKRDMFIAKEWQKNKNDFWSLPNPYAPLTHFDLNVVAKKPVMGPEEKREDGDYDITTQKVDVPRTFDDYQKNWAKPEWNHQFRNYIFGSEDGTYGGFLAGPNAKADIDRVNQKLKARGVPELGVAFDQITGKYVASTDRPDQIAAKIAIADQDDIEKKVYAEDRLKIGLTKRSQDIDWKIAKMKDGTDRYIANLRAAGGGGGDEGGGFNNIIDGVNADVLLAAQGGGKFVDDKGRPFRLVNGYVVDQDGKMVTTGTGYVKVPAAAVSDVIMTEYNRNAGIIKTAQGEVLADASPNRITPDDQGYVTIRLKGGRIDAISTNAKDPNKATYADRDQFADITQKAQLRNVTKYRPPTELGQTYTGPGVLKFTDGSTIPMQGLTTSEIEEAKAMGAVEEK